MNGKVFLSLVALSIIAFAGIFYKTLVSRPPTLPEVAFYEASRRGDLIVLDRMLAERPELLNQQDDLGKTALHYAVEMKQASAMQLLLDKKPDASLLDKSGQTPLDISKKNNFRLATERLEALIPPGT